MSNFPIAKFSQIMLFYAILAFILGPLIFYYLVARTPASAGNGFVTGSILSIILWYTVGSKMIK